MLINKNKNQTGQSILEVIIAVALFGLLAATILNLSMGGDQALIQGGDQTKAESLAQAGIEAVRAIRDRAWNELTLSQSGVETIANQWQFAGEGTDNVIDKFTRTINFSDVCRDGSNQITACPGSYTDVETKKVAVNVSWPVRLGINNSVQRISYLTNWKSTDWTQTDWSGGAGQSIWSSANRFDSTDGNINFNTTGQISLARLSGNFGTSTWPFDIATDYTYDSNKIEIVSSNAQLKAVSTPASGATTNPGFDTTVNPWVYSDWEGTGAAGTRLTSGGNPGPYINISIPFARRSTYSGYWQQSFTTTINNPTTAIVNFDWRITSFSSSRLTSYDIYIFVDSTPGAPILGTEVWSQNITSATNWATVSSLDVSSRLTTAGTYYIKFVARRIITSNGSGSGTNTVGFDNIHLNWSGNTISYPSDNPTVNPVSSFSSPGVLYWSGFEETATKNGGEIYYQLSDNNGSTWQYWNGGSWTTAGTSNYNIASVVNSNINKFATSSSNIMFRAFLSGDGTQQVQLDEIRIGYYGGGSGYETSGYLVSSAYNMTDASPVQLASWSETIPSCTPSCQVRLQVRTAPDSGGTPGTWTDWYGSTGLNTYLTTARGSLVPAVINGNQWVQYRAELTGDGVNTPVLNEVKVNYK